MSPRRIKGTHVPRMALAVIALIVFFVTLWAELVGRPIDFTQPAFAALMVLFLFFGILMLAASWVIGLESRAEILITLFMITLHVGFDGYIFVRVFALHLPLPVPLVQGVVQAYWIAGLADVLMMYAAANWEQTAPDWVPPERLIAQLQEANSQLTKRLEEAESQHAARARQLERQIERAEERANRTLEEANRMYEASCEHCGKTYHKPTQLQADNAVRGHQLHCQHKPENLPVSANGRRQAERQP